jgi:hypothetical protein
MGDSILSVGEKSRDQLLVYSLINVNPGLINPKRLFNWGGTVEELMTIGGVPS